MTAAITDPVVQTRIFLSILAVILLFSSRRRKEAPSFSLQTTTELKGFAILAIVFAHIGYYLAQDHRFLFPISVLAGVGVDTFLFLSGYGLCHSFLRQASSPLSFYRRRVSRIFIPLWIALTVIVVVDYTSLHLAYPVKTLLQSVLGFFPKADLYNSLNAPLWYLTLLFFYYFLFPLFFWKRAPILSAAIMYALAYHVTHAPWLPVDEGVAGAYHAHLVAFPLGIIFFQLRETIRSRIQRVEGQLLQRFGEKNIFIARALASLFLCVLIGYFAIHSGVGKSVTKEQSISLLTMLLLVLTFIFKPIEQRFLHWVGTYSYEIYLLHWPLLYRYDILYSLFPAGVTTGLYLFVLPTLGLLLQRVTRLLTERKGSV